MGKPTEEQLTTAIQEAARMRERGEDAQYVGKSLLNLNYRVKYLEKVLEAADRYLRHGQAERDHTRLLRAIEGARDAERKTRGQDDETYGLI